MAELASDKASKADKAWYEAFTDAKDALNDNLQEIRDLQRQSGFPAVAFVTFDSWETAQNVRRAFKGGSFFRRHCACCRPRLLKMKGKNLSLSDHLTQPTDVLW